MKARRPPPATDQTGGCPVRDPPDGVAGLTLALGGRVAGQSWSSSDTTACFTSEGGRCAETRDPYYGNEACTITVTGADSHGIEITRFNTESNYDWVDFSTVGRRFAGGPITDSDFIGFDAIAFSVGDTIDWASDGTVVRSGWRVCLSCDAGKYADSDGLYRLRRGKVHGQRQRAEVLSGCISLRWLARQQSVSRLEK